MACMNVQANPTEKNDSTWIHPNQAVDLYDLWVQRFSEVIIVYLEKLKKCVTEQKYIEEL